jgi:hypothetical protein
MILSRKMNRATTRTTSAMRRATTKARIGAHSAAANQKLYDLLDEVGAWLLFAGLSLTGWLVAAIAFGVV